jgi:hypothetical protein
MAMMHRGSKMYGLRFAGSACCTLLVPAVAKDAKSADADTVLPLLLLVLPSCRNPADVGGRMMTFTYVSAISGICAWSLPGGAESIFQRMSVS